MTIALPIVASASLGSFDEIVATVQEYMDRTDIVALIPSWIALAEAEINRRLALDPVLPMHVRSTLSLSSEYVSAPEGILDVDSIEVAEFWQLKPASPQSLADKVGLDIRQNLEELYSSDSVPPTHYARIGSEFRLYPAPETTYSASIIYWRKVQALTAGNSTNWLLDAHPDVYLSGILAHGFAYIPDKDASSYWTGIFDTVLSNVLSAYPTRGDMAGRSSEIATGLYTPMRGVLI